MSRQSPMRSQHAQETMGALWLSQKKVHSQLHSLTTAMQRLDAHSKIYRREALRWQMRQNAEYEDINQRKAAFVAEKAARADRAARKEHPVGYAQEVIVERVKNLEQLRNTPVCDSAECVRAKRRGYQSAPTGPVPKELLYEAENLNTTYEGVMSEATAGKVHDSWAAKAPQGTVSPPRSPSPHAKKAPVNDSDEGMQFVNARVPAPSNGGDSDSGDDEYDEEAEREAVWRELNLSPAARAALKIATDKIALKKFDGPKAVVNYNVHMYPRPRLGERKRPLWMGMQRLVFMLAGLSVWRRAYYRNRARKFLQEHPGIIHTEQGTSENISMSEYYQNLKTRISHYKEPIRVELSKDGEYSVRIFPYEFRYTPIQLLKEKRKVDPQWGKEHIPIVSVIEGPHAVMYIPPAAEEEDSRVRLAEGDEYLRRFSQLPRASTVIMPNQQRRSTQQLTKPQVTHAYLKVDHPTGIHSSPNIPNLVDSYPGVMPIPRRRPAPLYVPDAGPSDVFDTSTPYATSTPSSATITRYRDAALRSMMQSPADDMFSPESYEKLQMDLSSNANKQQMTTLPKRNKRLSPPWPVHQFGTGSQRNSIVWDVNTAASTLSPQSGTTSGNTTTTRGSMAYASTPSPPPVSLQGNIPQFRAGTPTPRSDGLRSDGPQRERDFATRASFMATPVMSLKQQPEYRGRASYVSQMEDLKQPLKRTVKLTPLTNTPTMQRVKRITEGARSASPTVEEFSLF
eukprot:TRINITY_DN6227_c0_g1_i1.p1 TRINITY_DN6227_c0_g1~~TRINITY_DN6227_c0_g1_i1.p1  ORF type:complete len:738 (+),score=104.86 TRINITY_DN6227_c0_g1_i1:3485-5698(+)